MIHIIQTKQQNHLNGKGVNSKMKMKLLLLIAISILAVTVPAMAFHNGSQLKCNNCHTMHYSEGGQVPSKANGYPQDADSGGPFPFLLVKANITDLCLQCHKDGAYSGAPSVYNTSPGSGTKLPGGDFGYSAKGLTGNAGTANVGRGHNPFGSAAHQSVNFDIDNLNGGTDGLTPPGGPAIASGEFNCTECHGVHGPESGNARSPAQSYMSIGYRLLKAQVNGVDIYSSDSIMSQAWVKDTALNQVVAGPDGADLTQDESATNHNVYKGGFSNFCAGCHPNFHGASETDTDVGDGTDFIRHPTRTGLGTNNTKYGSYDYNYPLVKVGGNWTNTNQGSGNVATTDEVMCLSCHKAHATANANSLRWDATQASALGQCNKCHQFGGKI